MTNQLPAAHGADYRPASKEEYGALPGAWDDFLAAKLWREIDDGHIMTLHHPDYVDTHLVVFGRRAIVAGFNIFIGDAGFQSLTMMLQGGPLRALGFDVDRDPEVLIMGCSADRQELTDDERQHIRQAGFRYRGRGNWPQLLRATVGFLPHRLDQHETVYATMAIDAAVDVASRIRRRELDPKPWRDFANFLHLPRRDDAWQAEWRKPPPPTSASQTLHIPLSEIAACPTRPGKSWFVGDVRPGTVRDPDISHRRFLGRTQIYVDDDTGKVFAAGAVGPANCQLRQESFLNTIRETGHRPEQVSAHDALTAIALTPICDALNTPFSIYADTHPAFNYIDSARRQCRQNPSSGTSAYPRGRPIMPTVEDCNDAVARVMTLAQEPAIVADSAQYDHRQPTITVFWDGAPGANPMPLPTAPR